MSRSSKALAGRWLLTAVTIGIPLAVVPVAAASAAPPTLPPGFVTLTDDLGRISVSVPGTWTDVDTALAVDDAGGALPFIAAAPNIDSFVNTFDTPGVRYIAFAYAPDPQTLVTEYGLEAGCVSNAVQPYTDGTFTGVVQVGTECGSGLATWNMVVASPADLSFTAVVQVQTASPADQQALDVILASFNVASTAPSATPLPGPATVPVAPLPTGAAPLPTTPATGAPLPTLAPAQVPVTAGVPGQTAPAGQTLTITDDTNRLTVLLSGRDGDVFDGVIVDEDQRGPVMQIADPAVLSRIRASHVSPGDDVHAKLISANPAERNVEFERVG